MGRLCDICRKREATIHIQQVVNNNITMIHLCKECAMSYGIKNDIIDWGFKIINFLNNLKEGNVIPQTQTETKKKIEIPDESIIRCPVCKITYDDFIERGKLGCGYCYTAFAEQLKPMLMKIHGRIRHRGREPRKYSKLLDINRDITELNNMLKVAIRKEKYKEAAIIRDRIKRLKVKLYWRLTLQHRKNKKTGR